MYFQGRLGVQQRVLPAYRAAFFDLLAGLCRRGAGVFAGLPLTSEGILTTENLQTAQLFRARNHHFSDPASPLYFLWQSGYFRWLQEWQPDVLIVEANPRYLATRLAIRWMHQRGRKVLGWGLGAPQIQGRWSFFRRWERLSFLRSLDGIIAYSRLGAEEYRALGMPHQRVFVALNAVEMRPKSPPPTRSDHPNRSLNVLFVGRLQERKRVDLLIRACAKLPGCLQPHLVIVGDGPAREELVNLAGSVYPQAEFVGAKHGMELRSYFEQADLFVLPGTGGLAVQQAMTHGLPVIVAEGDGTQDDLVRAENGWQIRTNDLDALYSVLHEALTAPKRLRQMGEAAYRIAVEEVNLETMAASFVQALNQTVK